MLLMSLGVKRSTIMEDYLLTNRVNAAKSDKYYHMMLSAGKTEKEAETIRDIFLAKEEYLSAAFSAMDVQYENVDAFLCDGLNIPQKLIERFKRSVLSLLFLARYRQNQKCEARQTRSVWILEVKV